MAHPDQKPCSANMTSPRTEESDGDDPHDYRITYFDRIAAESEYRSRPAYADGGPPHRESSTFALAMETRERVAAVETSVDSIEASVNRIEETVDEVAEDVSNVDDSALHEERFEDRYKEKILRNWRFWTVVKWVLSAMVTSTLVIAGLMEAGVL